MLRTLRTRRRPRYGAQVCAVIASLLLLLSVAILHSRLKFNPQSHHQIQTVEFTQDSTDDLDALVANPLLSDIDNNNNNGVEDRTDTIDELDVIDEDQQSKILDEEEILRGLEDDTEFDKLGLLIRDRQSVGVYYWDHITGILRRSFNHKKLIDNGFLTNSNYLSNDESRVAVDSDDQPVSEDVREKLDGIKGIEDALLLKTGKKNSKLREGWADWFEKKGDFLKRDKMFKSGVEMLNPLNNALLQDPDGAGVMFLTRGDKLVHKGIWNELLKLPPLGRNADVEGVRGRKVDIRSRNVVTRVERRTLNDNVKSIVNLTESTDDDDDGTLSKNRELGHNIEAAKAVDTKESNIEAQVKHESPDPKYADGKRWGYYPGLYSHLSFSEFMEEFFKQGKCSIRVFMVWNSPPWKYTVRYQRGLESLLYHHRDACVVVFSETIELDFFKGFVKDGFKVAVAMPNLDELLKDTPAHVFASVWFEWRKARFYPIHYSELVRLAALYKYGGLYLDSDMIVLKPLSLLNNTISSEDETTKNSFNGAVMSFNKNSPFVMECLREFYSTYDDTLLRWNGADLLTRTVTKFLAQDTNSGKQLELKIQPSSMFFPINQQDIKRYFSAPADESERTKQCVLLIKILDGSHTFHFWDGLTSSLIPEPDSLVAKLLNHHCIRCTDVL